MVHEFMSITIGPDRQELQQCAHCDLTVRNTELFLDEPCPGTDPDPVPAFRTCRHCGCANPFGPLRMPESKA